MADNGPKEIEDIEMSDAQVQPLMTEDEKRILDVYDRLEELQLEIALLKAQGVLSSGESDLHPELSKYVRRGTVMENILIVPPILRAVHGSNNATIVEQDLLPLVEKRDELSISLHKLAKQELADLNQLKDIKVQNVKLARENAEMATRMLALADEANVQRKEDIEDLKLRKQLDELEGEMKLSRQKWRIMKETASATVVGSGVVWVDDPKLRDIVLGEDCYE
ncbi:uncharacterized protein RAG0_11449 [Rhynchosporium agropyri]|uniref:Centromere protein H C-terminal domain-containing protein n=1 Tax=Rhynchosporium agropyri TaxID=914238 RepID=A0A1E1L4F8_9HELO|nr:uncharacterized protein RAG0_11449 [Rhynchosporium agropyri]